MKNRKWILGGLAALMLAALALAGCSSAIGNTYEFDGSWTLLGLATWQFGSSSGSYTVFSTYTVNFTYITVDENAKHILVDITSVTGLGSGVTAGVPAYITYSISGNQIYVHLDGTSYVTATGSDGPYTKQ